MASSASLSYDIAHFPFGGGYGTHVLFENDSTSTAHITVTFFNQAGAHTSVPLEDQGMQGSQQLTIGPNSTVAMNSDPSARNASPNTTTTWATVSTNVPLNIFSLFDYGPNPPAITGSVGAQSTAPSKSFRFPISVGGPLKYNAGMALANPNGSQTTVTVKVLNGDGTEKTSFRDQLPANGQTIFLLSPKVSFDTSTTFTGSVAVCATQPVGLVAIGVEYGPTGLFTISPSTDACP